MPVSTPIHLPHCLALIVGLQPKSVLDIGLGFGTWGFLCRTHLDVFPGRVQPEAWQTRIDGVELFEPYIQAHQRALYDNIRIADVRQAVQDIDSYDLIIAGDVIEHLDKEDACEVLDALYAKAKRALLVNIPIGDTGWEHGENHGNPGELHRSAWFPEDFQAYPNCYQDFALPNGAYGVFWCPKENLPAGARYEGLLAAANYALEVGRPLRALKLARKAQVLSPTDPFGAVMLANLELEHGTVEAALRVLEASLTADAASHGNYLLFAQLQAKLGQRAAACATLERLRALPGVAAEILAQADALQSALL